MTKIASSSGFVITGAAVKMLVALIASASDKKCKSSLPLRAASTPSLVSLSMETRRYPSPIARMGYRTQEKMRLL